MRNITEIASLKIAFLMASNHIQPYGKPLIPYGTV
jgi:hypothetical protein